MEKTERKTAEVMLDRLKKILPDLKLAYDNAKSLELEHNWDMDSFKVCEAYMNLADAYIGVMDALEEEEKGGEK